MLRVGDAPLRLLRAVRGIDLVELEDAEECCGFGGTFAVKNADTSMAMLWRQAARAILDTRAEVCTAADNSCLMHIGGALRRQRAGVRAMHLAEILAATERAPRASPPRLARRCGDTQLRRNMRQGDPDDPRQARCARSPSCPTGRQLREAGRAIKATRAGHLPGAARALEAAVQRAGGDVHWARDAAEANAIVGAHRRAPTAPSEVIKVKSLATDEIDLNEAPRRARRSQAIETDLAELIIQLAGDKQSHILVPGHPQEPRRDPRAVRAHDRRGRGARRWEATAIAEAAPQHLRAKFLSVPVAVSGANFGVAETGTICVVESEGNGRMCPTLPEVLVTVMGIEKVLPAVARPRGLPPAAAALLDRRADEPLHLAVDRRAPGDGPQEFHLVLLDNGRTDVLADEVGRQALHCIRCSACLNMCPVY